MKFQFIQVLFKLNFIWDSATISGYFRLYFATHTSWVVGNCELMTWKKKESKVLARVMAKWSWKTLLLKCKFVLENRFFAEFAKKYQKLLRKTEECCFHTVFYQNSAQWARIAFFAHSLQNVHSLVVMGLKGLKTTANHLIG